MPDKIHIEVDANSLQIIINLLIQSDPFKIYASGLINQLVEDYNNAVAKNLPVEDPTPQ